MSKKFPKKTVAWAIFCFLYTFLFRNIESKDSFLFNTPVGDIVNLVKFFSFQGPIISQENLGYALVSVIRYPWLNAVLVCVSAALMSQSVRPIVAVGIYVLSLIHIFAFGYSGNYWFYWIVFLIIWFLGRVKVIVCDDTLKIRIDVFFIVSALAIFVHLAAFYRFNLWSYHPDESVKLRQVQQINSGVDWVEPFLHPPLMVKIFAIVQRVFEKFEPTEIWYRVVQKLWTLIGVVSIVSLATARYGRLPGLVCLCIGLTSTLVFTTGFYLKEDAPLFGVTSLAYALFFLSKNSFLLSVLSLTLAWISVCFKYTGILNVIVLTSLLAVREKKLRFVVFSLFIGAIVLIILFPELFLMFEQVRTGFLFEVKRGLFEHHGFQINSLDFWFLYGAIKTFAQYENPFFFISVLLTIKVALRSKDFLMLFLFLVYYLTFELSSGKPPPQPERYYLLSYVFLLPMMSRLALTNVSNFVWLAVFVNLGMNYLISFRATERLLIEYIKNFDENTVVHTGYVVSPKVDGRFDHSLLHLNFNSINDLVKKDLPPEKLVFVTTNTHLYRYREFRLSKAQFRRKCFLQKLMDELELLFQIGSPFVQKGYLNNTYFVFKSRDNFSRVLQKARKCF